MFARPGRTLTEEETRRKAVKIEVAADTREAIIDRIAVGVDGEDVRGRQVLIGPSEIGTPCDFCLGARLAGLTKKEEFGWLAWIGTMVHAGLQRFFSRTPSEWFTEYEVSVGEINGLEITGKLDLFHVEPGVSVDYKVVGDRKLDKVRFSGAIDPEYRVQGHLYGRGLTRAGWRVTHVAIFYLPRNVWIRRKRELASRGFWWAEPYDEQIAVAALERADRLARHISELGAKFVLPVLAHADGCFDCDRWNWNPAL